MRALLRKLGSFTWKLIRGVFQWLIYMVKTVWPPVALSVVSVLLKEEVDWDRVWQFLSPVWLRLLVVFTIFIGSFGFRAAREKWPRAYGWTEIGIGMAIVWLGLPSSGETFAVGHGVKIAGGLYLMVRGHDNRRKARERPPTPAATAADPAGPAAASNPTA